MITLYDSIGANYSALRRPDPRIARQIEAALEDAQTLLNVGAGTGSYEPTDRFLIAVEPSSDLIRQRPRSSAAVVQCTAGHLPFEDDAFDAVMSVLSVHHWADRKSGLAEMNRVARDRVAILGDRRYFKRTVSTCDRPGRW